MPKLTNEGYTVRFVKEHCTIERGGRFVMRAERVGDLYMITNARLKAIEMAYILTEEEKREMGKWHNRMGHTSLGGAKRLIVHNACPGMPVKVQAIFKKADVIKCDPCAEGKMHRMPFKSKQNKKGTPGTLIVADCMTPISPTTPDECNTISVAIDYYSGWASIRVMNSKSLVQGHVIGNRHSR